MTAKMSKRESGRLGGLSTLAKYGRQHMQNIGIKGAQVTWQRYNLLPTGIGSYAMVRRSDGIIVAIR